jgi:hypothetical protein
VTGVQTCALPIFIKRDFINIDFLCIERKKRYMLLSEGEYKSKGYRRINKSEVENKFTSVVRDRQLRKLGISYLFVLMINIFSLRKKQD